MEKFSVYMPGLETESSKLAAQRAMHSQYVLQLLHLQRRAGFLCDITVNIEDKSFKAHKPLLAACSLYFRALFADVENAQMKTLNLTKLSPAGFEVLLDYIYSGSLAITAENSDKVLYAANCLQMTNVVETCLNFIRSSFQVAVGKDGPPGVMAPPGIELGHPGPPPDPSLKGLVTEAMQDNLQILSATSIPERDFEKIRSSDRAHLSPVQFMRPSGTVVSQSPTAVLGTGATSVVSQPNNPQSSFSLPPPAYQQVAPPNQGTILTPSQPGLNIDPHATPVASNPTHETLTRLMPYLVAKNARRPTLNEVRQLLLNGSEAVKRIEETQERFTLKQSPPELISTQETQGSVAQHQKEQSENGVHPTILPSMQHVASPPNNPTTNGTVITSPTPMTLFNKVTPSPDVLVASSTTNHATARTETTFRVNDNQVISKDMQPFVLINSDNNALHANKLTTGDSSKGRTWSEDRSASSDTTDLSGTPCAATVTGSAMMSLPPVMPLHSATSVSPMSSSSSPRIQISPASVGSQSASEMLTSPKSRWSRALSLDYPRPPKRSNSVDRQTSRSVGSRPLILRSPSKDINDALNNSGSVEIPQDLSARLTSSAAGTRISVEQANNAVGALYVGCMSEKDKKSSPVSSEAGDSTHEESKLVIEEEEDEKVDESAQGDPGNVLKAEQDLEEDAFPVTEQDVEKQDVSADADQVDGSEQDSPYEPPVKQERESSSTSPPPEDSFVSVEEEGSRLIDSEETDSDVNEALDLTMPKKPTPQTSETPSETSNVNSQTYTQLPSPFHPPVVQGANGMVVGAKNHPPKMQEALDALVMMQNSMTNLNVVPPQSVFAPNASAAEDSNSLTVGFSRKPRRSSGGQTCQWPGCGRLFRHRNIYEEHQKLHEMGVPVTQLRKCYMGARVKKTARERLEEMRMVDGSSASQAPAQSEDHSHENGDHIPNVQRTQTYGRRRKSTPHPRDGPDRKRVTVKDRKEHFLARNQPWQPGLNAPGRVTAPQAQPQILMPSVPPAMHAVNSNGVFVTVPQQVWQGGQVFFTNGGNPPPQQILTQAPVPSSAGMMPSSMAQQLHHAAVGFGFEQTIDHAVTMMPTTLPSIPVHQLPQAPPVGNSAVAATLAALGIQLPAKRGSDDTSLRHPKLDAPSPSMTLDQLRRRIALRETSGGPEENARPPTSGEIPLNASLMRSPPELGNVTGTMLPTSLQMSVPNQYHDQTARNGHGSQCS